MFRGNIRNMITNMSLLHAFERNYKRQTPADYFANLRIVEALCEEPRLLKAWPPTDPLAGINVDIRLARALNVHRSP